MSSNEWLPLNQDGEDTMLIQMLIGTAFMVATVFAVQVNVPGKSRHPI